MKRITDRDLNDKRRAMKNGMSDVYSALKRRGKVRCHGEKKYDEDTYNEALKWFVSPEGSDLELLKRINDNQAPVHVDMEETVETVIESRGDGTKKFKTRQKVYHIRLY